jgi:hypothetical protein
MFYKLPHPLQLLALLVLFWIVMPSGRSRRPVTQSVILLPPIVVLAVAESSPMQLGIRYVLPVIPFAILFASQAGGWLDFKTFPIRSLATAVLAAAMLLSVRYHPEHLAYFNELAGGPLGGREHLLDSNLDWGQDLGGLKKYLDEHTSRGHAVGNSEVDIGLAYFGTVPPAALGIRYQIPPANMPQPGRFAVSVNFEQGRPHWVRTPTGKIQPVDIGQFEYFGFFQPVARIGYSIDVFELSNRGRQASPIASGNRARPSPALCDRESRQAGRAPARRRRPRGAAASLRRPPPAGRHRPAHGNQAGQPRDTAPLPAWRIAKTIASVRAHARWVLAVA